MLKTCTVDTRTHLACGVYFVYIPFGFVLEIDLETCVLESGLFKSEFSLRKRRVTVMKEEIEVNSSETHPVSIWTDLVGWIRQSINITHENT